MTDEPFDLLIRDATLVSADASVQGNLAIHGGKIVAMGPQVEGPAHRRIESGSFFVLPGYIDAHVHLNEPGRESWEGFTTGTKALAAGGCTIFMDMPLNSTPVIDRNSFIAKCVALEKNSLLDGALWGGLTPGNLATLPELAACGVIGFKAFMSNSGMDDFPRADTATLREGMHRAAMLDLPGDNPFSGKFP